MEILVKAGDLKKRLGFAQNFVGGVRAVSEITKAVKLVAVSGFQSLVVEASDFTKACRTRVSDIEVRKEGACAVDNEQLGRVVRAYADQDTLLLRLTERFLVIDNGKRFVSKLGIMSLDEFPQIPSASESDPTFSVFKRDILSIVERLKFATAPYTPETPFSNTIFFDHGVAFATDRVKLAYYEDPQITWAGFRFPVGSEKLFHALDDTIQITLGKDQFFVSDDHHHFFIQTPICEPPLVPKVLQAFQNPVVVIELQSEGLANFLRAIQRAAIASSSVSLLFTPQRIFVGGVTNSNEIVDVVSVEPKSMEVPEILFTYDASYLQGVLGKFEQASLLVYSQGPLKVVSGGYSGLIQRRMNHFEQRFRSVVEEVA